VSARAWSAAVLLAAACSRAPEASPPAQGATGAAEAVAPARRSWPRTGVRAIWITRFDYRTPQDVRRIVGDCADAGFDTLLFQVRGNATAFYRSSFEPRAGELDGADPEWDPLQEACDLAHARGLELHAWANVVTAWWGLEPPRDPAQVCNARPEWLWYDQQGQVQPLVERFYLSLNPCLPEVRAYLAAVLAEIAARYLLDGLHLDYLRFPNEPPVIPAGSGLDYPRDARTLALYREASGKHPDEDPAAWDAWRTGCVTELLREIRASAKAARPGLVLSAAVGPSAEAARAHHFQDTRGWLAEGLLDAVFPMNYARTLAAFEERLEPWVAPGGPWTLVPGLRIDLAAPEVHEAQLHSARAASGNFCVFAYAALFDSTNVQIASQDEAARLERAERRARALPFLRAIAREDRQTEEMR
jgi:uncharacterized lipoprotein YddW (UPF0748 family)